HSGTSSHQALRRQPEEAKSVGQVKSGKTSGLEKRLGIIGCLLEVDRYSAWINGVEIQARVLIFFAARLRGCDRRGVFEKSANVGTVAAAFRNGSASGAYGLRVVHLVKLSPTFNAAHDCT